MYAHRQIYDHIQATIAVPPELQYHRTEVIFMVLDAPVGQTLSQAQQTLQELMGCWQGEELEREAQGEYEVRQELE